LEKEGREQTKRRRKGGAKELGEGRKRTGNKEKERREQRAWR
jgi:hypothetical protein